MASIQHRYKLDSNKRYEKKDYESELTRIDMTTLVEKHEKG